MTRSVKGAVLAALIGVAKLDLTLKKIPQGFLASYLHMSLNSGCDSRNEGTPWPVGLMPAGCRKVLRYSGERYRSRKECDKNHS